MQRPSPITFTLSQTPSRVCQTRVEFSPRTINQGSSKKTKTIIIYDSNLSLDIIPHRFAGGANWSPFDFSEEKKSWDGLHEFIILLYQLDTKKNDSVFLAGGGGFTDLGALACSLYLRGVEFHFIPTTLLSMVDSCLGGKTAINFSGIKNLMGNFSLPSSVIIYPEFLTTLPERLYQSAWGELFKYHILTTFLTLNIESADFDLLRDANALISATQDLARVESVIYSALKLKMHFIKDDFFDEGTHRYQLNLGHTLAHGLELLTGIYHGEAVSIGILFELFIAGRLSAISPLVPDYVRNNLSVILKKVDSEKLWQACLRDKKNYQSQEITLFDLNVSGTRSKLMMRNMTKPGFFESFDEFASFTLA